MNSREAAGLPLYPELRWVTLEAIRRLPMPATNDEIDEAVGTSLKLTPVQRAVRAANGAKSELAFRVSFCRSHLKIVGATPLDLIDGDNLCELLKERELGVVVRKRTVEDVTIDSEYFNRFEGPSRVTQRTPKEPEGGAQTPSIARTCRSSPRGVRWSYFGEERSEKNAADMYENIVGQLYRDHSGGADRESTDRSMRYRRCPRSSATRS